MYTSYEVKVNHLIIGEKDDTNTSFMDLKT